MRKKVYIALTADALHHGHMKLLEKGRSLGDVIVGLITDKVVSEYKRMPYLNFEQRKKILINFKGVTKVISQNEWDYSKNIKKIQPDYFIHGDDWRKGHMSKIRSNVIKVMKWLNDQMEGKQFVCLDRYTIADITALVCFDFAKWPKIKIPEDCINLSNYYERLNSRPSAKA